MTYAARKLPLTLAVFLGAAFAFASNEDCFPPADKDGGWRTLPDPGKILAVAGIDVSRLDWSFGLASRNQFAANARPCQNSSPISRRNRVP